MAPEVRNVENLGSPEIKVIALSTKTESSYTFEDLVRHEGFKDYNGPIAADFVIKPGEGVRKEPILAGNLLVGFKFSGMVDGRERVVINIDHHDSDPRMQRAISTANLAAAYIDAFGYDPKVRVAISHYDCDSISGAAILSGAVERKYWNRLGKAVIAADHTGEEDVIADTLQGLDEMMSIAQVARENGKVVEGPIQKKSLVYAFQALRALLAGKSEEELPEPARRALEQRRWDRMRAEAFISDGMADVNGIVRNLLEEEIGRFQELSNRVYYVKLRDTKGQHVEKIATELLSGLLPNAVAIIEASPLKRDRSRWEVAIRAGMASVDMKGFNFHNLGLEQRFNIGGRWNAGSSGRSGGQETERDADNVAKYIAEHANELAK